MQRLIVSGACGRAAAAYVLAQCSCFPGAYTFLLRNVDPVDDYSTAVAADEDMRWWTIRCAAAASSGSVRLRRSLPTALLSSAPLTRNKNENRPVVVPSHEPRTSVSLLSSSQEAEKRVVRTGGAELIQRSSSTSPRPSAMQDTRLARECRAAQLTRQNPASSVFYPNNTRHICRWTPIILAHRRCQAPPRRSPALRRHCFCALPQSGIPLAAGRVA